MLTLFLTSLWIGIIFCAPPGVITTESIRRGFSKGFVPALLVQLGSLVGDAAWATIALMGLAFLVQNSATRLLLAVVGAGLLFYLARGALQDAQRVAVLRVGRWQGLDMFWGVVAVGGLILLIQGVPGWLAGVVGEKLRWSLGLLLFLLGWWQVQHAAGDALPMTNAMRTSGDFAAGAVMSLGNPWNIIFWLGIGSKQLALLSNPQLADYFIFIAGFMTGALLWCLFMAGLIAWGRRFLTPTFFRRINLVCGLLLAFFALDLLWQTMRAL